MNLKLFYSPPKWMAFEAPEKPQFYRTKGGHDMMWLDDLKAYEKAYAEAKANALEVGNPSICPQNMSQVELGKDYDWPHSAVIKDGKYILQL